jgi:plastocyanin
MKTYWMIAWMTAALALRAGAGTLVGTVSAEGKLEAEEQGGGGKYDSHKLKFAERVNYAEMRDFVVYIEGPVAAAPAPEESSNKPVVVDTRRIAQRGAQFTPHVLPVREGTVVEWPNHDEIFHNVFSMSEAKPFDLGLYKGNPESKRVTFDKPGRVDVYCSIHSSMHCVVLVLENPYFAVTDGRGHYTIENVPPGKYRLKAWHERLPPQTAEIIVPATGEVRTDFVLGIKNLPQY